MQSVLYSPTSDMEKTFKKIIRGYQAFRKKYATGRNAMMKDLAQGQQPDIMVVSCCDSRVDPALILQCDPGDLFIVRNVANIVPPYEKDSGYHGTSAALEFGICYLNVKHLIILGHSQCGGINALLNGVGSDQDDFLTRWVSIINAEPHANDVNTFSQQALFHSYENCLTFPWIKTKVEQKALAVHLWFFDIKAGQIFSYSFEDKQYQPLTQDALKNKPSPLRKTF